MQGLDGVEPRVQEARDARFLAGLRRSHGVAGHADDAIALAEQVQGLGRFLGEADDTTRVPIRQNASG